MAAEPPPAKPARRKLSPVRKALLVVALVIGAAYAVVYLGAMIIAILAY